jgi:benzoyl-CoA reductase/2-hydroxyglutaryl-CoA dehydratase subunit BcrC/BadD/HgdB
LKNLEGILLPKHNGALAVLDRGNPNDAKVAMNDLKALINQVETQTDKKITPEAAEEIIQRVNTIIENLGG